MVARAHSVRVNRSYKGDVLVDALRNDLDSASDTDIWRIITSAELRAVTHRHYRRVVKTLRALGLGARDDDIAQIALICGILVEDLYNTRQILLKTLLVRAFATYLVPIRLDGTDTTGDDLIKQADDASFGKVLWPGRAAIFTGNSAVLVVVVLPNTASAERGWGNVQESM